MQLQKLVFETPNDGTKDLMIRGGGSICDGVVKVKEGENLDLTTYFNLFSAKTWKEYTHVKTVALSLEIEGKCNVVIYEYTKCGSSLKRKKVINDTVDNKTKGEYVSQEITLSPDTVLGAEVRFETEGGLYGGGWTTNDDLKERDVRLALCICTFKKEAQVTENINRIKEEIFKNPQAPAHGKANLVVVDNGHTLSKEDIEDNDTVMFFNKNYGGAGGFTRGMIEAMHSGKNFTHIVLMDDDAVTNTEAINRAVVFLSFIKEEYMGCPVGGTTFSLQYPAIQQERGAKILSFETYEVTGNQSLADVSDKKTCILCEWMPEINYNAWCLCLYPRKYVEKYGYPLPLFLHYDDIEYGSRNQEGWIYINGFATWHEHGDGKFVATIEYYNMRNWLIVSSICGGPDKGQVKRKLAAYARKISMRYLYRCVDYLYMGTLDYLKGFKSFVELEPEEKHKSLMETNYKLEDIENFVGYKGLTKEDIDFRMDFEGEQDSKYVKLAKKATLNGYFLPAIHDKPKVLFGAFPRTNMELWGYDEALYVDSSNRAVLVKRSIPETARLVKELLQVCKLIDKRYDKVSAQWRKHWKYLTTEKFWRKYLEF